MAKDVVLYGPNGHLIQATMPRSEAVRALQSLSAGQRSMFKAAERNRHNSEWSPSTVDINYALVSELSIMRRRSRWLAFNDSNGAAYMSSLINNCVGTGFHLSMAVSVQDFSQQGYKLIEMEAHNDYVEERHAVWSTDVLVDGALSSPVSEHEFQEMAFRNWATDGEVFAHQVIDRSRGKSVPVVWEIIDPEQLDCTMTQAPNGNPVVMGIELDRRAWRPVAYWVFVSDTSTPLMTPHYRSVRIPAEDMVHLFKRLVPRQLRGVPFFHAVMSRFYQLSQFDDAQLIRNKIASMFSAFVSGGSGGSGIFNGSNGGDNVDSQTGFPTDADGNIIANLQPGIIGHLPAGYSINMLNPTSGDSNYDQFIMAQKVAISAGAGPGMSYTGMTRDTSRTTFAGGRMAENMEIQGYRPLMKLFADRLLAPRLAKWMDIAVLIGEVTAPTYDADREFWLRHKWKPGGWSRGINPAVEVEAAKQSMREGITTLDDECAYLGRDYRLQMQKKAKIDREKLQLYSETQKFGESLGLNPWVIALLTGANEGVVTALTKTEPPAPEGATAAEAEELAKEKAKS